MKFKVGFTLLELLIVISIVSLLLLFSIPNHQQLYEQNQLKIVSDKLKNAVQYGQTMTFVRNVILTLAPLDNQNWSQGLVLFIDNKNHRPGKDKIIQIWQWPSHMIQVNWQGFQSSKYLIFSPNLKNASCNGHFLLKTQGNLSKKIIVNRFCYIHDE
ncbi:pilus assembly FimT family protein [Legionella gresilensis]|uniref:pilus assembly FimT family protein n=1 Tax=Legionella gresilensis TaxID=91823 RepID=UPI0010410061|nr:prepilin-type N-terminal cleavage/methylation domain-containing protein [Legionella gresilensis]